LREVLLAQMQKEMADRAYGAQGIGGMLQSAVDFRKAKGALLQGGAGLQANAPNPWSMLSQGLGMAAGYAANNRSSSTTEPTSTTSTPSGWDTRQGNAETGWYGANPGPYSGGYVYPEWQGSVPSWQGSYSGPSMGVSSGPSPGPYASGYQFNWGR